MNANTKKGCEAYTFWIFFLDSLARYVIHTHSNTEAVFHNLMRIPEKKNNGKATKCHINILISKLCIEKNKTHVSMALFYHHEASWICKHLFISFSLGCFQPALWRCRQFYFVSLSSAPASPHALAEELIHLSSWCWLPPSTCAPFINAATTHCGKD